jgi:hypothetical protein
MTRTSMLWRVAAALFILVNVAGAGYAVAMGEPLHAGVHVALLVAAYVGWRSGPWARRRGQAPAQLPDARLDYLQQSVDAVALEVERIGEAQRFSDKLRSEKAETSPPKKPHMEEE